MSALLLLSACSSVPLTGRKQVLLVSDQEVLSASLTQYTDYMKTATKSTSKNGSAMVARVGKNIADATEKYLKNNGLESEVKNFSWELAWSQTNRSMRFVCRVVKLSFTKD